MAGSLDGEKIALVVKTPGEWTQFAKLSNDWNAEPGAPMPEVCVHGPDLTLTFFLNPWRFSQFKENDRGEITFRDCWRYRLSYPNDEGWYRHQCRFSRRAPDWGEFYEVSGNLLDGLPEDWIVLREPQSASRHFLFYFKDDTFECDAADWSLRILPAKVS